MKWILLSISLCFSNFSFSLSEFATEEELIEYISGVWNMDSLYGGWIGLNQIPSPYFGDSSYIYFEFLESDVPETPLLFRHYRDGIVQEETSVTITFEQQITFAGYWFLEVNAQYFPISLIVAETGYEPTPIGSSLSLVEYAFDANTYYLSKCFPEFDVHGAPIFTQYLDEDGDEFGSSDSTVVACDKIESYSYINGDCDDTDASINPGVEEIAGNDIDENCDGLLDTSNIEENQKLYLEIFPNPTLDYLHIKSNNTREFQVSVYSIHGNQLCSFNSPNKIRMSSYPSGFYILKYAFDNGSNLGILKIVKE